MGFCFQSSSTNGSLPSSDLFVDPSLPPSDLHAAVRTVCRRLIDEWSDVADEELCISQVSGGITNLLLKVSLATGKSEDDSVTVRIFGPNTDAIIDREREFQGICALSIAGFGAELLGVFKNGLVQSFINARTLTPSEISTPKLAALIAKELRRLHKVDVHVPKEAQLWPDLSKLLNKASDLSFDDTTKQKAYASISFDKLREEIEVLKGISDSLKAPVIFSHNDLLSGNLMYNEAEEKIILIDFEYSAYSYRGYDIGNHFAEYAGFECDYSLYPDKEAQYHFFRNYLNPQNPSQVTDAELEELYVESNFYSLLSHLFWAVWAIVQAKYSPIDFDYLGYFFKRIQEYEKRKDEFVSLATKYIGK